MPVSRSIVHVNCIHALAQKHYCDYCDVFLTHDSASGMFSLHGAHHTSDRMLVRKAHNSGRNHLANVRDYYAC